MELKHSGKNAKAAVEVYLLWQNESVPGNIRGLFPQGDFTGKSKETLLVYTDSKPRGRVLLVGLGEKTADLAKRNARLRQAAASLVGFLQAHRLNSAVLTPLSPAHEAAVVEAALIADYRFRDYQQKKAKEESPIEWLGSSLPSRQLREIATTVDSVNWARDLVNHPSNWLTPRQLASHYQELKKLAGVNITLLDRPALRKEKLELLLAVSRGSEEAPYLVIGEYKPKVFKNKQPIVLVGKGVTFDSGGLNIKPSGSMEDMKIDMAGSAAAFATIRAAARLKLPYHLVAVSPLVENMISGRSLKPGDIVRTSAGLTVEIGNTDAEGRLILADALDYATRFKPELIVDLATLTGACMVALGTDTAGAFARDQKLIEELVAAGDLVGEYVWSMPLDPRHEELIKSDHADINNAPVGLRWGGAIQGAVFLSKFVPKTIPWIHLDIAGPTETKPRDAYREPGATGFGVRLLIDWLKSRNN
ncbi:leucyl aminopeptidase family protein [Candidatus Berkelbacteria bacterium]|nr:leucyl aminopeptidase family protein [Candidatus Berkelbacteria bacterium]